MKVFENIRARYGRTTSIQKLALGYRSIPQEALADLAEFCGAIDPAPKEGNSFAQGRAAGRRDVWLHVAAFRGLREEEVYALLKGEPIATAWEKYRG